MATDHYQLRVLGLHQFEYNECVMHFKGDNLTVANYMENAQDLVTAWINNALSFWMDLFPESYTLMRCTAKKASAGGGGEYSTQFQWGDQLGQVAGPAASQQLCPVVRLIPPMGIKTAGKMFLPCIAASQISGNQVNSTWLTNLDNYMNVVLTTFSDSSILWQQEIFSRKDGTFSLVQSYDTSPIIGFQRRRQRSFM